MDSRELQDLLVNILDTASVDEDVQSDFEAEALHRAGIRTYEERGVMTYNKGLVVRLTNGDEFQITIVQSMRGAE